MNKKEIFVPKGIRYMSEWKDFRLEDFPYIIDKQIPGCGFTHWCLTNQDNIILCSPRKVLLENKKDQLGEDVFLVKSYFQDLGVDKDISSKKIPTFDYSKYKLKLEESNKAAKKNLELIKGEVITYWYMCQAQKKPVKILVTYDSYYKIKEIFKELGEFDSFHTIIDEWQSVFIDARFKSDTELEFLNALQDVQKVCYVSATPMLEEYLEGIPEFKNLPYHVLDWKTKDPKRVIKPILDIYSLQSVKSVGAKIINSYKSGDFVQSAVSVNGVSKIIESKEAVIYVNSVNNIINLIKWNDLTPNEVNILCADTEENQKRIKSKLGKEFSIGKVPTKNEPRKMFTFCTRTVYLGADFYSDNARTFIISDANVDSMAVDITLDLPQILGRQRLSENPWKNKADLYVKVIAKKNKVAIEEFKELIKKKLQSTESLLRTYDRALDNDKHEVAKTFEVAAITLKYRDNYVAVNTRAGKDLLPCTNNLAYMSEVRAFEIQQVDYADRFSVFNRVDGIFGLQPTKDVEDIDLEVSNFMKSYNFLTESSEKMKLLCTTQLSDASLLHVLDQVAEYHKKFYIFLGPERCKALGYNYSSMNKECSVKNFDVDMLAKSIYSKFTVGDRIPLADIKQTLKDEYSKLDYKKTAKATDIQDWFEVRVCTITTSLGKKCRGYELLKKRS